jgi:hypothetical protein
LGRGENVDGLFAAEAAAGDVVARPELVGLSSASEQDNISSSQPSQAPMKATVSSEAKLALPLVKRAVRGGSRYDAGTRIELTPLRTTPDLLYTFTCDSCSTIA